jgi:hypothetical protein
MAVDLLVLTPIGPACGYKLFHLLHATVSHLPDEEWAAVVGAQPQLDVVMDTGSGT